MIFHNLCLYSIIFNYRPGVKPRQQAWENLLRHLCNVHPHLILTHTLKSYCACICTCGVFVLVFECVFVLIFGGVFVLVFGVGFLLGFLCSFYAFICSWEIWLWHILLRRVAKPGALTENTHIQMLKMYLVTISSRLRAFRRSWLSD